jgi:hypothetical protein
LSSPFRVPTSSAVLNSCLLCFREVAKSVKKVAALQSCSLPQTCQEVHTQIAQVPSSVPVFHGSIRLPDDPQPFDSHGTAP